MTDTTYTTHYTRVATSGKTVIAPEPTQVQLSCTPPLIITNNTPATDTDRRRLNTLDYSDCL